MLEIHQLDLLAWLTCDEKQVGETHCWPFSVPMEQSSFNHVQSEGELRHVLQQGRCITVKGNCSMFQPQHEPI